MNVATQKLEDALCKITGSQGVVCTSSGSGALMATISLAVNMQNNYANYTEDCHETIIVPNFGHLAAYNAASLLEYKPMLVDVTPDFVLDIDKIPWDYKPAAVVFINHGGYNNFEYISRLKRACEEHNAILIEDSATCLGCYYDTVPNKHVGTIGDFSILSFSGKKIISSGQGGAIIINKNTDSNEEYFFRNFINQGGFEKGFLYKGTCLEMSHLIADYILNELPFLEERVEDRIKYLKMFSSVGVPVNPASSMYIMNLMNVSDTKRNEILLFIAEQKKKTEAILNKTSSERVFRGMRYKYYTPVNQLMGFYDDKFEISAKCFESHFELPRGMNKSFAEKLGSFFKIENI